MPASPRNPRLLPLGVFLLAALVCALYFQELMLAPNTKSPTFGGDGLTIHYNLQYHATYGGGAYLSNQYHPYRESIFMTDAQSVVAIVLAALRPVFPDIGTYAVGISNTLIFWSTPLAILLLFLIFRRLGVNVIFSVVLGIITGLLSPQLLRQLGGQYTLGYTFLLPLVIWYLLSPPGRGYGWRSLLVGLTITVVGLNNPYLYAIAVSFLLAVGAVAAGARWLLNGRVSGQLLLHWLGVIVMTTAVVYGTLHYFDRVEDRVAVPFGFFHNVATWGGLLSSPDLYTFDFVHRNLPGISTPHRENQLYLGFVPAALALLLPFALLVPGVRRRLTATTPAMLPVLTGGALLGLVFAFGLPFAYFPDWTYAHLGSILQFRAPVRFAWPLYYVLAVVAGYALWRLFLVLPGLTRWLVLLPLLAWAVEAHQFTLTNLKGRIGPNAFHVNKLDEFRARARELGIDTARYSSIYLLPSEQGWSDKLHRDGSWRSNHDGYKYSLATGLPLLNGKLSRVSLSRTLGSLQFVSDPLIPRSMLPELDPDKSILVLTSLEDSLSTGERGLFDSATPLYANDRLALRRLSVADIRERHAAAVAAVNDDSAATTGFLHVPMEEDTAHAFVGRGSRRVAAGWQTIVRTPLDTLSASGPLELSLWNYVDGSRFGGPKLYLRLLDADGERLAEHQLWANESFDTQDGWLRLAFEFTPPPGAVALELVGEYFYPYYLDELQLRLGQGNSKVPVADGSLLNNYLLPSPQEPGG